MSNEKPVLLEFSMFPTDKGDSVSEYVSRSLDIIDKSGVDYRLGPMGTTLEGTWEDCMKVVNDCFERMSRDCGRIAVNIKVDYRKGHKGRLVSKVDKIEKTLGREIKK